MRPPTDWIALAKARGLELPAVELERVVDPLRQLETQFRPLAEQLPFDLDPVLIFEPLRSASLDD